MTGPDKDALDALRRRLKHVYSTAELLTLHGGLDTLTGNVVDGIAATLEVAIDQLDAITKPVTA